MVLQELQNRRTFLRSAIAGLLATKCSWASESSEERSGGCILDDEAFDSLVILGPEDLGPFPTEPDSKDFDIYQGRIISGSGKPGFDRALGKQLGRLSRDFSVIPGFGYYDDWEGKNALAHSHTRVDNTAGTVVFGLNLLRYQLDRQDNGELAVLAICAHEFGHIHQFFNGQIEAIHSRKLPRYCVELQADFLAGFYMRKHREYQPKADLEVVGRAWEELGPGDYNLPGTHGTAQMRVRAITSGYRFRREHSDASIEDAAAAGFEHVSRYG